MTRPKK
jgi:hypothetical protein